MAESISAEFARNCVAVEIDDTLADLSTSIAEDARVRLITRKDPEALHVLRHSAAHVMAQAILRLFKDAKLTIGPAIADGFYYDIDLDHSITPDDFADTTVTLTNPGMLGTVHSIPRLMEGQG